MVCERRVSGVGIGFRFVVWSRGCWGKVRDGGYRVGRLSWVCFCLLGVLLLGILGLGVDLGYGEGLG